MQIAPPRLAGPITPPGAANAREARATRRPWLGTR